MSELFCHQSSRWLGLARDHLATLSQDINAFVKDALSHIVRDPEVLADLLDLVGTALSRRKVEAEAELEKLHQDEKQQPITYNHYYTDNVQKARLDSTRELIKKAMSEAKDHDWNGKFHVSNNQVDAEKLLASLQNRVIVNMDKSACAEAVAGLEAYYKVLIEPQRTCALLIKIGCDKNVRRQRLQTSCRKAPSAAPARDLLSGGCCRHE